MSKVWRRLQRVGKKASKFRFATFNHNLVIDSNSKWQPDKVSITWSHRDRKISSRFGQWEPGFADVYKGKVLWEKTSDAIEFDVTLYRDINGGDFEEKEWILMIESEDSKGKRRLLATGKLSIEKYANMDPQNQQLIKDFKLKIISNKIKSICLDFSISSQFLKDGKATDEDMISVASFMSVASGNNPYLNSNSLSDKNYAVNNKKTIKNDASLSETNKSMKLSESGFGDLTDDDPDNIDYYLKLQSKQNNLKFESISQNFNNTPDSTLVNTNVINKNDFQDNFLKMFDSNNQIKVNCSSIGENNKENRLQNIPVSMINKSQKTSTSHLNTSKTLTQETLPNIPAKQKITSPVSKINLNTDEKNPFLENNNETIILQQNIDDSKYNPFLESPTKTNDFETDLILASPPQLESTVKCFTKDEEINENTNNKENNAFLSTKTTKDLLEWCKEIVKKSKNNSPLFKNLIINDFSSSWTNGLAFCAIIHHFRPNLIDLKQLSEKDSKNNLKLAFRASDNESIVRVVDYGDLLNKKNPDQLSIMTYLYHIFVYFEPKISKKMSKKLSTKLKSSNESTTSANQLKVLSSSKKKPAPILNETLVTNEKNSQTKLNNSYFNPFESDDEESENNKITTVKNLPPTSSSSSGLILIKSNGEIVDANSNENVIVESRDSENKQKTIQRRNSLNNSSSSSTSSLNSSITNNKKLNENGKSFNSVNNGGTLVSKDLKSEDLIQKAKELMEKNKKSISQLTDEESELLKKEKIKQRAKQMIAETRKNSRKNSASHLQEKDCGTDMKSESSAIANDNQKSRIDKEVLIGTEYINQEIINLKNKQTELDEQGNNLEQQLRALMKLDKSQKKTDSDKELEDTLLRKWFLLVNEKNALLMQQQELEILQNEKSLEKRYEILSAQLRNLMQIEDFRKTEEQKKNESILFNELITLVNKRNELVLQLDEENKLLTEGEIINDFIQNKSSFQEKEKPCVIQ